MESLNLNTLATSLPSGQQKSEAELLNNFKAAALSITTLYRSSRQASKRAYNAGYASACQDLLTMIQQGVSASGFSTSEENSAIGGGGMTIGKVMDWTEARLEEIKGREEEEDEDEEREKEKERRPATGATAPAVVAARATSTHATSATPTGSAKKTKGPSPFSNVKSKEQHASLPTPLSPVQSMQRLPAEPSSPSPPPSQTVAPLRHIARLKAPRSISKADSTVIQSPSATTLPPTSLNSQHPHTSAPFTFRSDANPPPNVHTLTSTGNPPHSHVNPNSGTTTITVSEVQIPVTGGTKRRHAMMLMESTLTPTAVPTTDIALSESLSSTQNGQAVGLVSTQPAGSRRRTRSTRSSLVMRDHNVRVDHANSESGMAMDVEEDERERKRVFRR